ncbi:bifunctional ADP-dependent NAD(P)H-hydrate dehydratase/NAD(P)H-hydrate epimerase [Gracilibacillus lacisalsi]|uniref:bifunctional ADP-dependent NAD(P)H-hydrate dehydratase/NAD(P)H-hydrate epimerase n=1 Tax=Gracilibacillus lacisalsi TaxID=393087 RepID=UPI000379E4B7|nr:bifunctional ADP-dependent NAD(P)H-hydrate dehydratase/NAD(P)H-hydrate epimerase [Gracilibacillus lacisalsi]
MYIVTAEEMYEIDRYAIEKGGIEGKVLMENAGSQVAQQIIQSYDNNQKVAIVVGSGNNGGDGFVIARYLAEYSYDVSVFQLVADHKIKGDAAFHKALWLNTSDKLVHVADSHQLKQRLVDCDIVIDAILGIGVSGAIREPIRSMIDVINHLPVEKISVDIPSGLPANDGIEVDLAIHADQTYIIEAPKETAFCEEASIYYGVWKTVKIGIPQIAYAKHASKQRWCIKNVRATFPKREKYAHKGSNGRGLVIGGQQTMPGAIVLAARAALRSGAGLVTVATIKENLPIVSSSCIEATYHLLPNLTDRLTDRDLEAFEKIDAITFGMGIGRDDSQLLSDLIEKLDKPLLIDADGLYHAKPLLETLLQHKAPIVVTPHYGEMAMLTNKTVPEVKRSPFSISRQFAEKYQVYVVLKGKHTIITAPNGEQIVSDQGNAGLAKGGTGDVLSGILLTMIMQHEELLPALANGCYLHGTSADYLVEDNHTERDLLATDVIEGLSQVFRTLS